MQSGERYRIWNTTLSGKLVEEGIATLVRKYHDYEYPNGGECWYVSFDDDKDSETGEPGTAWPRTVWPKDKVQ